MIVDGISAWREQHKERALFSSAFSKLTNIE